MWQWQKNLVAVKVPKWPWFLLRVACRDLATLVLGTTGTHYQGWCEGWYGKGKASEEFVSLHMEKSCFLHRDLTGLCTFWPWACQHYFVYMKNFHWPHAGVHSVHYFKFWGRGDQGFWLCVVASLMMYCIDASLRIVTKSLYRYRTDPPFSLLNAYL